VREFEINLNKTILEGLRPNRRAKRPTVIQCYNAVPSDVALKAFVTPDINYSPSGLNKVEPPEFNPLCCWKLITPTMLNLPPSGAPRFTPVCAAYIENPPFTEVTPSHYSSQCHYQGSHLVVEYFFATFDDQQLIWVPEPPVAGQRVVVHFYMGGSFYSPGIDLLSGVAYPLPTNDPVDLMEINREVNGQTLIITSIKII